ncbi:MULTISPECIES: hypothetical protein [Streptomyces]|uniref:hypothetical protein n=1 Tax=Streptomyces TaxID=1883 RepID=UPI0011814137|nr:hypothetical protein [Streptomyces kasugaensis]
MKLTFAAPRAVSQETAQEFRANGGNFRMLPGMSVYEWTVAYSADTAVNAAGEAQTTLLAILGLAGIGVPDVVAVESEQLYPCRTQQKP